MTMYRSPEYRTSLESNSLLVQEKNFNTHSQEMAEVSGDFSFFIDLQILPIHHNTFKSICRLVQ